jgi:hypothetical protein
MTNQRNEERLSDAVEIVHPPAAVEGKAGETGVLVREAHAFAAAEDDVEKLAGLEKSPVTLPFDSACRRR